MQIPYRKPTKFSNIPIDPLITKEKLAELQTELDTLKWHKKPKAAAEVSRLAEFGDFSENAEYQLAKGRLRGINSAIIRLEAQINQAVIIEPHKNGGIIQIGHTVTVEQNGKQKTYQILGSSETNPELGIISHTSPLGSALLGHTVGEQIIMLLGNKESRITILRIE